MKIEDFARINNLVIDCREREHKSLNSNERWYYSLEKITFWNGDSYTDGNTPEIARANYIDQISGSNLTFMRGYKKERNIIVPILDEVGIIIQKSNKIKIDINDVRNIIEQVKYIDELNFEQIEWYENGNILNINKESIEEWRYTGLGNVAFVEFEGWKGFQNVE